MSYDKCDSASAASKAFCAAVAGAIAARAHERSERVYVACQVLLAHRTVVVAGELGFWPPMGAFEGVCDGLESIVREELRAVQAAGWSLDASTSSYSVINRLQRLPAAQARELAAHGAGRWRAADDSRRLVAAHGQRVLEPPLPDPLRPSRPHLHQVAVSLPVPKRDDRVAKAWESMSAQQGS
ncbi:MAG: hypothetical protein AAGA68_24120 [Pseudomonadota bacterium]